MSDFNWTGREDTEEGKDAVRVHHVMGGQPEQAKINLAGFACDAGVSRNHGRPGAALGPDAIRHVLKNLAWHQDYSLCDMGNVYCKDDELEQAQSELAVMVSKAVAHGKTIVLGGGHEVAWGSFQGLASHFGKHSDKPLRIGIINFDAHFDLRSYQSVKPSSGTPFNQIADFCHQKGWPFHYACLGISRASNTKALFKRADELGVWYVEDKSLTPTKLDMHLECLQQFIDQSDLLYLSIDMDVFPAATAPGVSAPAATGVCLDNLWPLMERVMQHPKLALADIAEYNPDFDTDARTARLAARLVWEIASTPNRI